MKPLSRRHFLRSTGALMALPLLEAMIPTGFGSVARAATAAARKRPVRLGWLFYPNGVVKEGWEICGTGRDFTLNVSNAPLQAVRDDVLFVSNLAQREAATKVEDVAGAHARGTSSFLTAASARKTNGNDIYIGVSADQVAAKHIGTDTRLPSIELGVEEGKQEGRCDNGYSCVYLSNISWRSPTQPCGVEINPRRAFDRLFGVAGPEGDAFRQRAAKRQSVLDFVGTEAKSLLRTVGSTDRRKLDEYFTSVREVELYIDKVANLPPIPVPLSLRPPGDPENVVHHMRIMYDLMALSFQTDATRVATLMLADGQTNQVYEHLGLTSGHHQLTHSTGLEADIQKIDRFMAEEFARFVAKLKATPDGDDGGSLLDNCLIAYGSDVGDGRNHNQMNMPCVVAGHGGGAFQPGRHVFAEKHTPLANVYVSMLQAASCPVKSFGDSTGPFAGARDSA